jgi:hypothetical protein
LTFGLRVSLANEDFPSKEDDPFDSRFRHQIAGSVKTFRYQVELTGENPFSETPLQDNSPTKEGINPYLAMKRLASISKVSLSINDLPFLELRQQVSWAAIKTSVIDESANLEISGIFNHRQAH